MNKLVLTAFLILITLNILGAKRYYYLENGEKITVEKINYEKNRPVFMYNQKPLFLNGEITAKTDTFENLTKLKEITKKNNLIIQKVSCTGSLCYTTIKVPDNLDPFEVSENIYKSGSVKWVQPDWKIKIRTLSISNDTFVNYQWHLPAINVSKGWRYSYGMPYAVIAVLDSGVSIDHEDLMENIIKGKSFAKDPQTGVLPMLDAKGYYNNMVAAHGTSVAGIVGAVTDNWRGVAGVCGKCSVMPVKFFDYTEQYIQVSRVLNAFKWMVDNGASVINNSWGEIDLDDDGNCISIPMDNYRNEAVKYASEYGRNGLGTVVVWAAGNSSCDTSLNKNYDNQDILLAGAIDRNNVMTGYTNYGDRIDIVLPDASFTTDIPGIKGMNDSVYADFENVDYTGSFTGTSASAAVASGVAGLIISVNPSLTSKEVAKCMKLAAFQPEQTCYLEESERKELKIDNDPTDMVHTKCFGFGIIDVEKALKMAKEGKCGKPYNGCKNNSECPVHFKCDKEKNLCTEDINDPLPRYKKESSAGCSVLFLD
jgi:subtilisin family serine protease